MSGAPTKPIAALVIEAWTWEEIAYEMGEGRRKAVFDPHGEPRHTAEMHRRWCDQNELSGWTGDLWDGVMRCLLLAEICRDEAALLREARQSGRTQKKKGGRK